MGKPLRAGAPGKHRHPGLSECRHGADCYDFPMPRPRITAKRIVALPASLTRWAGYVMQFVFDAWYASYDLEIAGVGLSVNGFLVVVVLDGEGAGTQTGLPSGVEAPATAAPFPCTSPNSRSSALHRLGMSPMRATTGVLPGFRLTSRRSSTTSWCACRTRPHRSCRTAKCNPRIQRSFLTKNSYLNVTFAVWGQRAQGYRHAPGHHSSDLTAVG